MSVYLYTALRQDNSYVKDRISAFSQKRASQLLEKDDLLIINIKREKKESWKDIVIYSSISRQEKIQFVRHLHAFLDSGVSLDRSLSIAVEQMTNPKFKTILSDIHEKVVKGQPLNSSLRAHNRYFSNYFINMIRVGEESGRLDNILKHLLEQQEKEYEMITRVRGALIYPALIVLVAILIIIFLLTFVIPTIASTLSEYGAELPLPTKIIIAVSDFVIHRWWFVLMVLISFFGSIYYAIKKYRWGKRAYEKFLFKTPGIKTIVLNYNIARATRSVSAPLLSGLGLDKSIELSQKTLSNNHYQEAMHHCLVVVQKGIPLSEALLRYPEMFTPNVTRLVEVGEKTGRIDEMMSRLADFHEKTLFNIFGNISSIIEPFLLVMIGLVVGFITVSVLTPIWRFAETI